MASQTQNSNSSSYMDYTKDFSATRWLKGFSIIPSQNVRRGPSTEHPTVATIIRDEAVIVVGESDGWYKVNVFEGQSFKTEGWAHSSYMSVYWYDSTTQAFTAFRLAESSSAQVSTQSEPSTYFTLESTKADVQRVMGTPTSASNGYWSYKYSAVYFDNNDRVSGWSNISSNLKAWLGDRDPNAAPFSIGSSKTDVLKAMGTPTSISNSYWNYNYSAVKFDASGRVSGWSNISSNLRAWLGDRDPNAPPFSIGSSKTDVLKAMGTPTSVSNSYWNYNYSAVSFDANGRVSSWSNISSNLKVG